jgi:hypothetical protein
MGGACSAHGRDGKCVQSFVGRPEWKRPLKDVGVGGMIILEWKIRSEGGCGLNPWAQDGD